MAVVDTLTLTEQARANDAFVRSLVAALSAVEDQLQNLDAIEEVDPSYMSKTNCSAGGVAAVIRGVIAEALGSR